MRLTATELHRRGLEATNARRFAQARRTLAQAAERTDDPELLARISGTLAYALDQTGQPAEAEQLCRTTLAREGLNAETRAILSGQLGALLTHSGRLDEAEEALSAAIDAMAPGSIERANCLMTRSVVRMQRHDLDRCREDLEQASEIFAAHEQQEPHAEAQHNLGYVALLAGDLVTALALMTKSRPTLAATSDLAAAISDLDRAEVLRDAGLTTEAEELLRRVATLFGAQRMRQARAEAELHLSRSLLHHDAAAAERVAGTAARRFTALGSSGWAARAEALRLEARVRARPARPPAAEEFAAAASALDEGGFATEATALRLSAWRAHPQGRLPRVHDSSPTPLRLRLHEVRAHRAARAGRNAEARRHAAAGLELLASWQQSFGALDLQASVSMHGTELVFAGLAAASGTDDPAVLFEWSERARHLSQQVRPVRPPHDPALAGDLAELRMLRADLAGADWTDDPRVRALRDSVRERQWSSTATAGTRERVTLGEAAQTLSAADAALSFVFTGDELRCIVTTATDARIVNLEWSRVQAALDGLRGDLDMAARSLAGPMGAVVARSLDDRLARLDGALLAPVLAGAPDAERFVLTVPGALGGIPWAMLPSLRGRPFTLATSMSRWLAERGTARVRRLAGFAAGPRVPRAIGEVEAAASAWKRPTTLTGSQAQVDAVADLAATVDVLHVAAHGRHAADNPLFSGLELADGTLFGYDVDRVGRAPDVVILSACELGRSSVRWGEEALGMTRVWLHAGTQCVIAAPVEVADAVAAELLSAVHDGLASGVSAASALATAAESTGLRAPFQCHGSGF